MQTQATSFSVNLTSGTVGATNTDLDRLVRFDPDLSGSYIMVLTAAKSNFSQLNERAYMGITDTVTTSGTLVKRLTRQWDADTTKLLLS